MAARIVSQGVGPKREPAIAADLRTQDTSQTPRASTTKKSSVVESEAPVEDYVYDPTDLGTGDAPEDIDVYLPTDRIPAGEIIYIRNNTQGTVRFVDSPKENAAKFNLKLGPAGKEDSVVSIENFEVLRNPGFQRWWKNGKLTVTNDPTITPLRVNTEQIEIDRLQSMQQVGTLDRTAANSLPIPVSPEQDFSFLEWYDKKSPNYKL